MNNELKISEYRYMDEFVKINRADSLKKYLKDRKTEELEFYDLNMYYQKDTFNNKIISKINQSVIDEKIILNKYQIEILNILKDNNLFLSAPTSFGKTFLMLEYIKRNEESINNIIIIIPTLALMNELLKKIYNLFSDRYNICINAKEEFTDRNIFIFVPERSDYNFLDKISKMSIDLLIFDEIYKLQASNKRERSSDDRLIYMNKVYLDLVKKAKKISLLGPYINSVSFDRSKLDIVKYYTNYLPVYNKITVLQSEEDWINYVQLDKQLIYFSSPESIYKNIELIINKIPEDKYFIDKYNKEIKYLEDNINKDWYVISLLKRGIGIHHGKTPMFLRKFYENEYNKNNIKILLCTNTLMEGINTPTNSLIIVDDPGSNFKMNNLIGRVGRLNPADPKIGSIIISSEKAASNLNSSNSWLDLKILAEDDEINDDDEIIYLEKEYSDKEKNESLNKKIEMLNQNNITVEQIKNNNLKINDIYRYINENMEEKMIQSNKFIDYVDAGVSLIRGSVARFFLISNYIDLEYNPGYKYLPYKYYIVAMLNNTSFKEIVNTFNNKYNITNNKENINKFIDALYELSNYIKFKLSKFVNYIELTNEEKIKDNRNLQQFIGVLSNYKNFEITFKIMDDLGINEDDSKIILEFLNISQVVSTSMIIRRIKANKDSLLQLNISPFTKNNIINM